MGIFDLFKRKRNVRPTPAPAPSPGLSSAELRDAIFDAHARGDQRRIDALLGFHFEQIRRDCLGWTIMPEPLRMDPARAEPYVNALGWLAQTLQRHGDDRLFKQLVGDEASNPILKWDRALKDAERLGEELRYDEAISRLGDMLIDTSSLRGPGMRQYVPMTHGMLGHLCFHSGRLDLAKGHYETALRLCREYDDADGIRVYSENLYELHRYLGRWDVAAEYAERTAAAHERLGNATGASRMRRQAGIVRAGEPLLRVVVTLGSAEDQDGAGGDGRDGDGGGRSGDEIRELDDVHGEELRERRVRFHFARNRPNLRRAQILTERGRALGSDGKLIEALAEFRAAAVIDPYDPQPRYEEAFTLMQLERYADAAAQYDEVERLAPGWFNARSDGWVARHMAAARWPHEAFAALLLEDAGPDDFDQAEKLHITDAALAAAPDLPRLHLLRARTLDALQRRDEAAAACRAGLACAADDDDARSRLLLHLHTLSEDDTEKVDSLRQAIGLYDTGNRIAAAMARVTVLAQEGAHL